MQFGLDLIINFCTACYETVIQRSTTLHIGLDTSVHQIKALEQQTGFIASNQPRV